MTEKIVESLDKFWRIRQEGQQFLLEVRSLTWKAMGRYPSMESARAAFPSIKRTFDLLMDPNRLADYVHRGSAAQ